MLRCLFLFCLAASVSAQTPVERARALHIGGDASGALAVLLDETALDADGQKLAARVALEVGRPHVAAEVLAEADTADGSAQLLLGRSLEALGNTREAERAYGLAVRADSSDVALSSLAGLVARRNEREAIGLYRALVARDSLNPTWLGALGRALARSDSLERARAVLERAYLLYPRGEATAVELAKALEGSAALSSHLDRALNALPHSPELWRLRGAAAMRSGDLAGAVRAYGNALASDDSTATRLRDLGVAQYYEGSTADALGSFHQSLARDSTDATALRVGGFAAHAENQTDLALDWLARAADALGRLAMSDLAERTAKVHSETLNDEAALAQIALAEALAPELPILALHRATILQQLGRSALAMEAYREFLDRATPAEDRYVPLAQARLQMMEASEARRARERLRRQLNE